MEVKYSFPYKCDGLKNIDFGSCEEIYARIEDEISRKIYTNRVLLSLTKNNVFSREIVLSTSIGYEFLELLKQLSSVWIYGHGTRGLRLYEMFPEVKWKGFIDRNISCITNQNNVIMLSFSQIVEKVESNDFVVISNLELFENIKTDLILKGIDKSHIISLGVYEKKINEYQYFEKRCFDVMKDREGVFIDAGSYDGTDSIKAFNVCKNIKQIIALEPDRSNYIKCLEKLNSVDSVLLYEACLSDKNGNISFISGDNAKSRISDKSDEYVETLTIDSLCKSKRVGIIKMDIEGSEVSAIEGGRHVIKRDKPGLIISIYHKEEDIFTIPKLIIDINPEYRFRFGHYGVGGPSDTVLYAV